VTDSQAIIKPYLENILKKNIPVTDVMIVAVIDKSFIVDICFEWGYIPVFSARDSLTGEWTSFRAVKIEVC
jgi:hypothetical protein